MNPSVKLVAIALVWGFAGGMAGSSLHDVIRMCHERAAVTIESITIDGDDIPDEADEPEGIEV